MVAGTYLISAALTAALGFVLLGEGLTTWSFMAFIMAIFFLASAGASSAYLTVSRDLPDGDAGALDRLLLCGRHRRRGHRRTAALRPPDRTRGNQDQVAIGFFIGAAVMTLGGIAELVFGVKAEQKPLEEIAEPLTAAEEGGEAEEPERKEPARPVPAPRRARGRFRPGPGPLYSARAMYVSGPHPPVPLDSEVAIIGAALQEHGSCNRRELRRRVGARYWGPGRFGEALRQAVAEGRARPLPKGQFAPTEPGQGPERPSA